MCGRFTLTKPERIGQVFGVEETIRMPPRYNIAPGQKIAFVFAGKNGRRELAMAKWGLVPSWAKDEKVGYKMINARAETLAEKPAYRAAYQKRRCLIPADGFYEWRGEGKDRQPYYIRLKNRGLFGLAGLWEHWRREDGSTLFSVTIITTEANSYIAKLHDRMPAIIQPSQIGFWFDSDPELIRSMHVLKPYDPYKMIYYPVSPLVNDIKHDQPECLIQLHSSD